MYRICNRGAFHEYIMQGHDVEGSSLAFTCQQQSMQNFLVRLRYY